MEPTGAGGACSSSGPARRTQARCAASGRRTASAQTPGPEPPGPAEDVGRQSPPAELRGPLTAIAADETTTVTTVVACDTDAAAHAPIEPAVVEKRVAAASVCAVSVPAPAAADASASADRPGSVGQTGSRGVAGKSRHFAGAAGGRRSDRRAGLIDRADDAAQRLVDRAAEVRHGVVEADAGDDAAHDRNLGHEVDHRLRDAADDAAGDDVRDRLRHAGDDGADGLDDLAHRLLNGRGSDGDDLIDDAGDARRDGRDGGR